MARLADEYHAKKEEQEKKHGTRAQNRRQTFEEEEELVESLVEVESQGLGSTFHHDKSLSHVADKIDTSSSSAFSRWMLNRGKSKPEYLVGQSTYCHLC
jgi:hypothetical protein